MTAYPYSVLFNQSITAKRKEKKKRKALRRGNYPFDLVLTFGRRTGEKGGGEATSAHILCL